MNSGSGPFNTSDFGKQMIQSAENCWTSLCNDPILKAQFHEALCWDNYLDPEQVSTQVWESWLSAFVLIQYYEGGM
jgi:hypothetical protein